MLLCASKGTNKSACGKQATPWLETRYMVNAPVDLASDTPHIGRPKLGLALGSGSARGWAHIGIIQELEAMGYKPDVVVGTSIGALVGAVYVSGMLEDFTQWVSHLSFRDVLGFLDIGFSGGVVKGEKLFNFFSEHQTNPLIEELDIPFATVATDMATGREAWIRTGRVLDAARASCALPGLFSPVRHQGQWMLDGGLVNPVPVSVCRALGAQVVIAVNLNGQLVGRHLNTAAIEEVSTEDITQGEEETSMWDKLKDYFASKDNGDTSPGFLDVIGSSVNIMQDRITRSRMAGDPPEINLVPVLADFALMDFHRAKEAIDEGRRLVRAAEESLRWLLKDS